MSRLSYPKEKINVLLLESIHPNAVVAFAEAGYDADLRDGAASEEELLALIRKTHVLGIRSKTQLTPRVIEAARQLLAVGCFCIGTNQVALDNAAARGIPVFNAPFSNTRSVAELALADIVMLARKAAEKSALLHQQGRWLKSAKGCFEVKGKTVGIIGYGHIGPQVGLLAEAFGMRVIFYDIVKKLPLGTATACTSLDELLQRADFVTLHVPETAETKGMIAERELQTMKRGSYLLNLSRGSVVELTALKTALEQGQLAGAALDVYPREPKSNDEPFDSEMRGLPNVILTPHIGGSTEEAQQNIGLEVAASLIDFMDVGSSLGAVNLPGVRLPLVNGAHRVLNFHRNVPGALSQINRVIAEMGVNIHSQQLSTQQDVGYLIMDVDSGISRDVKQKIDALDINIRTRLLF